MVQIDLPPEYGYVLRYKQQILIIQVILSGVASFFMLFYLGSQVGNMRKKLGVPLPYLYADMTAAQADKKKELFNCYQRGHQNALETYAGFLMLLFLGGIKHPLISAVAGLVWSAGRIAYAWGYQSGDPSKRSFGGFQFIGLIVLLGTTISFAYTLLRA